MNDILTEWQQGLQEGGDEQKSNVVMEYTTMYGARMPIDLASFFVDDLGAASLSADPAKLPALIEEQTN